MTGRATSDRAANSVTERVVKDVVVELATATRKFGPMASGHEGWAVIQEEVEELWELIKANRAPSSHARQEAIQIAAMAIRYVIDVCDTREQARRFIFEDDDR